MIINEDTYRNNQLDKYLDGDDSTNSNCCHAAILEDSDICSECREHCVTVAEEYEIAMSNRMDEERESKDERD